MNDYPTAESFIDAFYSNEGVRLNEFRGVGNGFVSTMHRTDELHPSSPLDQQLMREKMHEIAANTRVLESGGVNIEVATVNNDVSDNLMFHGSTYSSSISTNMGNGKELAEAAVRYPDHKLLYVAFPSNGASSPMPLRDALYFARNGRMTETVNHQNVPLDYINYVHAALEKNGLSITHLMGADSAGGHLGRALATVIEPDQISAAHFSETSGFRHMNIAQIGNAMIYKENRVNKPRNEALSNDPERYSDAGRDAFAEAFMAQSDSEAHQLIRDKSTPILAKVGSLLVSAAGLAKGPRHGKNPLAEETQAMIQRHPHIRLTYSLAELDPLYGGEVATRQGAVDLLEALHVPESALVRTVFVPHMTHNINTWFPELYHAVKRYALGIQ